MLRAWNAPQARATKDIDLLGRLDNSLDSLTRVIREVCAGEVEPDGMVFDPNSVQAERIKEDADYEGVRVRFVGTLGKAKASLQLDVGFGDVVTPTAQPLTYLAMLDFPAPQLVGYPRETVIAEKFQAMVFLGAINSRMKDFYDIWLLARQFEFTGTTLAAAISATFAHRGTTVDPTPLAFTPTFYETAVTRTQWTAFRRKAELDHAPETLGEVVAALSVFLQPIAKACLDSSAAPGRWRPGGPWQG
jgi:hypothetical protein